MTWLDRYDLPDEVIESQRRHVGRAGGRVPLTRPGSWGVHWPALEEGTVLTHTYFAYALYCGELFAAAREAEELPFRHGSEVCTVGFVGRDSAVAGLANPYALARVADRRPFDAMHVNAMVLFEGRKCSSSKRHGIWVAELLSSGVMSSDELRFALAGLRVEVGPADLRLNDMVDIVNHLRDWTASRFDLACRHATLGLDHDLVDQLVVELDRQAEVLRADRLEVPTARDALARWMDLDVDLTGGATASTWLLGVALLGEPIVPRLAQALWTGLGRSGHPTTAALACEGPALDLVRPEPVAHIEERDLIPYVRISTE